MIEFAAEFDGVPAVGPRGVTLVLGVVHLAVLWKVSCQPKAEVRVGGIGEPDVRRTGRHVFDGALRKSLATRKFEKARAVANANLLHEIGRPSAGIVPSVLPVLSGNSHERAAGDGSRAQGGIAVLVDEPEKETVLVGNLPITAAYDLPIVKIVSDWAPYLLIQQM